METKITKLLDSKGVEYRLLPHQKPVFTCEEAAEERKVPLEEMVKCILLVDKKKRYFLACVSADKRLDTQKVRDILGCSRLSFASEKEIEEILGYKKGAIPPLLLKTDIPAIFDNKIMEKEKVNISSGDPSAGLELSPKDLVSFVDMKLGDIT